MPKSCLFVGQYGPKVCPTSKPQTGNGLLGYDIVDPTMIHHPVQAALAARLHWKWTLWPRGARDHRECDPVHLLRNWTTRGKAREKRDMSHKTRGEHFRIGFKKVPCPRYFMTWKHDYFFTSIFCHEWGICANHCLPAYFFLLSAAHWDWSRVKTIDVSWYVHVFSFCALPQMSSRMHPDYNIPMSPKFGVWVCPGKWGSGPKSVVQKHNWLLQPR
jgi:hypothetical protein